MSIRYKLILAITAIILLTALPIAFFFLAKQEQSIIADVVTEGKTSSKILAQSTMTILLMNAGNLSASRIDAREMIDILKPYMDKGLIYADSILLSTNPALNGTVLASIESKEVHTAGLFKHGKIGQAEIEELKSVREYRMISINNDGGGNIEMVSMAKLPDNTPLVIGRIIFSREAILDPVREMRNAVLVTLLFVLGAVAVLGFFFSTYIFHPIEKLSVGVEKIEAGDLDHVVAVSGTDELGRLGDSFNRMARILNMKISELQSMNVELARLDSIKDEFLANTSHELRTPINGIIGISESLMDGAAGKLNETALHNLSMIATSGRRLFHLINDILDLSRLKNTDITLNRKPVDIHTVMEVAVTILAPLAKIKNLEIRNNIAPGLHIIHGDEDRLQQIFLNLLDNALKFTDEGIITLDASASGGEASFVLVSVRDTGIGIPRDRQERIFDSFVQADGSISRTHGGTGLGLAITRKLVELHGGTVNVKSEPDRGSVFTVAIPIYAEDVISPDDYIPGCHDGSEHAKSFDIHPPDITIPGKTRSAHRGKILVVDDDLINLQVMINNLGLAGYEVKVLKSGQEALNEISHCGPPDLVLLDVMMPVMTGYEVCRRIRENFSPHELPVIMLTAKKNPLDIVTGFNVGANDYIAKPFDRQELLSRVNSFVALKKSVEKQRRLTVIQKELESARDIQTSILPLSLPRMEGLEIAIKYSPMQAVGGDFYDFHRIDDKRLGIIIADVSGHGMPASMIGAMLKISFSLQRTAALEPEKLIAGINTELCKYAHHHFITANYLLIDLERKLIVSSNAGHWPLPLYRKGSGELSFIYNRSQPIGVFPDTAFGRSETEIEPGDRIILYTDGIIECRNRSEELYGEERFHADISLTHPMMPENCLNALYGNAETWMGAKEGLADFDDDVCLMCVDIL